ncbi:MAG: flagellar protein [Oligoflexia bacterium]|nr:flagellar protein [Oligoflexia bacterium]
MSKDINNILIPNVSKLPKHKNVDNSNKIENSKNPNEFKNLLNEIASENPADGLNLSVHAQKRLKERNLEMDQTEFFKIKNAIEKLRAKGGQDSLVITGKAAYIVDVNNNKIVTAIDKDNMAENVFTKIDSTVVLN